jgi:hypothetical protein
MALPEKSNQRIPVSDASKLTAKFRASVSNNSVKAGFFWKESIDEVLAQKGCAGIRYYYASNTDGSPALVLVGVDNEGNDMVDGTLVEFSRPCPPYCASTNSLNS